MKVYLRPPVRGVQSTPAPLRDNRTQDVIHRFIKEEWNWDEKSPRGMGKERKNADEKIKPVIPMLSRDANAIARHQF
jgi:hypothetical protein